MYVEKYVNKNIFTLGSYFAIKKKFLCRKKYIRLKHVISVCVYSQHERKQSLVQE